MDGTVTLPTEDLDACLEHAATAWPALRGARLFVTGGTGFFGRWLLSVLGHANRRLALGCRLVVLSRDPARFAALAPDLAEDPAIQLWHGDVRDFPPPPGPFSHVIHAAADTSVAAAARPMELLETIVGGTRRVLDLAVTSGAEAMLMTSSGAIYGDQPAGLDRLPEDHRGGPDPLNPRSLYGQAKRLAEQLCALQSGRLRVPVARCFAFVGPHLPLDGHFAIGNFIRDALSGERILVQGDGLPQRSYLYAGDLAAWLLVILAKGQTGRAYNVGSDQAIRIADLAQRVGGLLAPGKPVVVASPPQSGAASFRNLYIPDVQRARTELGLEVWTSLDDAIRRTAAWTRAAPPPPAYVAESARPRTFVIDVDGVVATLAPDNDYRLAEPIAETIAAINTLYQAGHRIVMLTARGSATGIDWGEVTRQQFADWGLLYHDLQFGKPAADHYVDDRMLSVDQLTAVAAGAPLPPSTRAPRSSPVVSPAASAPVRV